MEHAVSSRAVSAIDPISLSDEALQSSRRAASATTAIGRVNTPANLARWMAQEALGAVLAANQPRELAIVEPAAGSAVIVAALMEELGRSWRTAASDRGRALRSIWAIDSDSSVRPTAGRRLQMLLGRSPTTWLWRQYRIGDSLVDSALLPRRPIDLIIGNPPYLGLRHASRLPAFDRWQQCFGVREDLYAFFMRWAMRTVRAGGHVALLVPDGWLSLASYAGLRQEVLQGRLRLIARLRADTFDRDVFPCFFVWQKAAPARARVRYIDARQTTVRSAGSVVRATLPSKPFRKFVVPQSLFERSPHRTIFIPTPQARRLAELWRLLAEPTNRVTTLAEVVRAADVGIHSRNCRHRLFFARRVKPGLQRVLQGRQIEPYAVRWDSPRARYRWVDIHYVPRPGVRGRRGDGRPSVRDEYWDWQGDPAIHRLPERILIRQTGDHIVAARCIQGRAAHYTDNTLFTATLTDAARSADIGYAYLLAYLNSAIITRLYRFLSGEHGRPQAQIKIGLLRRLPFVWPSATSVVRIERLVRRIERAVAQGAVATALRRAVDRHFEQLFARAVRDILSRQGRGDSNG
ncbi:MAG TPA: TaqI-like C-terminal specificity domain-containing protein [Phycisphaerae bacterium]|nr:TaqI-like C-terminal specificity domain-containing protein [Phycisphaerae bacterium]